jgi:hypothetical protein
VTWVSDFWKILETVASLTKEVERLNAENKDLRSDLNSLTQIVSELRGEVAHQKETSGLVLGGFKSEIEHAKESIAAKFDVLTTRLDMKVQDFENRIPTEIPDLKRTLTSGTDN